MTVLRLDFCGIHVGEARFLDCLGRSAAAAGGFLVTASCSHHVGPNLFLEKIRSAAEDAGKTLRLVEFRGAGKDHPRIMGVEEGHYLKFAIFEVRSR